MIIVFIIITLLSWLVCCSQLENILSFHSKRRIGKFIYHVRKVNSYVFELQGYRFLCLLGYGTVPTVWYCLFCLSNMFELFRQCVFFPLYQFVLYFHQFIIYLCIYLDNCILFKFFIPFCGVRVRFSVCIYSHLFCRVHVLFVICFVLLIHCFFLEFVC